MFALRELRRELPVHVERGGLFLVGLLEAAQPLEALFDDEFLEELEVLRASSAAQMRQG